MSTQLWQLPLPRAITVLGLLLSLVPGARANMAAPDRPGDRVTEPAPQLSTMHIVHEELSIDMRDVGVDAQPARIKARYEVRNDGPAQTVELFFVAPGLRAGQVRHQGKRVSAQVDARATAALGPAAEQGQHQDGLSFAVEFVPGVQVIEVSYDAAPDRLPLDLVESFAIDYVLAPARRWASFGTLSLELHVPDGWELVDLPRALAKKGDGGSYRAEFTRLPTGSAEHERLRADYHWHGRELPADTLRFHVAPPLGPYRVLAVVQIVARLLTVALPILAALRLRRRVLQRGTSVALGERLLSFVLTAGLIALLPLLALWPQGKWYPNRVSSYDDIFALLGTWALAGLLCVLGHALLGWARTERRAAT